MTITLTPEQEAILADVAKLTGRTPEEVVVQVVMDRIAADEARARALIAQGRDLIERHGPIFTALAK